MYQQRNVHYMSSTRVLTSPKTIFCSSPVLPPPTQVKCQLCKSELVGRCESFCHRSPVLLGTIFLAIIAYEFSFQGHTRKGTLNFQCLLSEVQNQDFSSCVYKSWPQTSQFMATCQPGFTFTISNVAQQLTFQLYQISRGTELES